ncbi:MAG: T9SS type A sorting domain-containing protein [Bacteroidetes bacterium]|nr:T9SS type A sorting domain-containing protein [Bacteroidota bacterium]
MKKLIFLLAITCSSIYHANAQTWPSTTPGVGYGIKYGTDPFLNGNVPGSLYVRHINCDMYTDYYSGSAGNKIWAVVWDYNSGGGDTVCCVVYDESSSTTITLKWPGSAPDVVLVDDGSSIQGHLAVVVAFLDGSNNVKVYPTIIANAFSGIGIVGLSSGISTAVFDSYGTTYDPPHIDACPDPVNYPNYWPTFGNTYVGLTDMVVTWSSDPGSGTHEVYAKRSGSSFFSTGSPTYIDAGRKPDVASVVVDDGMGGYSNKAYFIYTDGSIADINWGDWDMVSATGNANGAIETSVLPQLIPRIDAMNVENTSIGGTKSLWQAVAEVQPSTQKEIHGYDYTGSVAITNYSSFNPLNGGLDAYMPAIGVGCGPDGYAPGASSAIGNTSYTTGWYIQNNEIEALSLDNAGGGVVAGYAQVNNSSVASTIINYPLFAVSSSSNSGDDILTAWCDGLNINVKHSNTNAFAFKTTSINTTTLSTKPSLYPNPAIDKLYMTNINTVNYTITDVIGKIVLSGKTDNTNTLNISGLAKGNYIFNITENGKTEHLKFTKQ